MMQMRTPIRNMSPQRPPVLDTDLHRIEQRILALADENRRLNGILTTKNEEIQSLKRENQIQLLELHKLRGEMQEVRGKESEKWRFSCNQKENQYKEVKQQNIELLSKVGLLQEELNHWRQRHAELDGERLKQVESIRQQTTLEKDREYGVLKQRHLNQITEMEGALIMLSYEYDKVKNTPLVAGEVQQLQQQNNDLMVRLQKCEQTIRDADLVREKNKYLSEENQKLLLINEVMRRGQS